MLTEKISSLSLAKNIHSELISIRRNLHQHPETGFDLERTAKIVADKLTFYGLPVKTHVNKTGVVADLDIPGATKKIAFRADMDALPMQELNEVPYKSLTPMKAHMCGHDAHTAMLLGAAKILSENRDRLNVSIRFIFQPSEEVWPGGAPGMIEEGVLDGISEIYALHVWPTLDVGGFGVCVGPTMAKADGFTITIKGKGGHAGSPKNTINPILMANKVLENLEKLSLEMSAKDAVLSVTQIHSGSAYNVIPEECYLTGTVRTYDKSVQQDIRRKMEGIVSPFGKLEYLEGYPALFNHAELAEKVRSTATLLGKVDYPAEKVMFGEDFAYYCEKVKGCFIHLGCRNEKKGITHLLHEPYFDIDEDCLFYGTALFLELGKGN